MKRYLVGGAVRDKLLNIPVTERDWVVIGSTPKEMIKMGYQQVGKDFPVFLHPKTFEEHALARTERKIKCGHTGFTYFTSPKITLEEDLYRRDLTINAIACDETGKLIDPYFGQEDIRDRYLRHVSESFNEDPLRVLRVARFAARFAHLKFKIFPETLNLMKNMTDELLYLSYERIWKETKRALCTKNPQVYFKVLHACGALKVIFPEIYDSLNINKNCINRSNKAEQVSMNTFKILSIASNISEDLDIRFAALCCSLNKKFFPTEIYGKNKEIELIEVFCKRLKVPNSLRKFAKVVFKHKDTLHKIKSLTEEELLKFLNEIKVWKNPSKLEKFIISSKIDFLNKKNLFHGRYFQEKFLKEIYEILNSINVRQITSNNCTGNRIKEKLNLMRLKKIKLWKLKKNHK